MYATHPFHGADHPEALTLSDAFAPAATAFQVEVSGMNCRARIPVTTQRRNGDSSAFDDPGHGGLMPVAVQLHAAHLDKAAMPHVDASLTRRYINEVMEDLLDLL